MSLDRILSQEALRRRGSFCLYTLEKPACHITGLTWHPFAVGETQAIHIEMPQGQREMSSQFPAGLGIPAEAPNVSVNPLGAFLPQKMPLGSLGSPALSQVQTCKWVNDYCCFKPLNLWMLTMQQLVTGTGDFFFFLNDVRRRGLMDGIRP